MTDKQIIIDGVDIKDCKRRIGKNNFCRYYKRPCAENNYNCIWKKYLRKEQECKELKQTLTEIKEIAKWHTTSADSEDVQEDMKQILQKISECEVKNEN